MKYIFKHPIKQHFSKGDFETVLKCIPVYFKLPGKWGIIGALHFAHTQFRF